MHNVKRYAGAAVVAIVAIAMFFRPHHAQQAIVQQDPRSFSFENRYRRAPAARILVYVAGAVVKPGLYRLAAGARGIDAVRAAGGLNVQADPAGVNLAEALEDGEQITAPRLGERIAPHHSRARRTHRRRKRGESVTTIGPIDLNGADVQTLMQLPGIGAELAQRIVAFRDTNGPFASLDELADVAGITPRMLDALTPYIVVAH